jgi:hypothetical protein
VVASPSRRSVLRLAARIILSYLQHPRPAWLRIRFRRTGSVIRYHKGSNVSMSVSGNRPSSPSSSCSSTRNP